MENQERICDEMSKKIVETAEMLATSLGRERVTVRKILQTMGITNRVFYNRFHNVDEVLSIVYESTAKKIRKSMAARIDPNEDFFEQVIAIVTSTLRLSYENKMHFNQYVFESDSSSDENYEWWKAEIIKVIELGKETGVLKQDVQSEVMSYAIWCFIRGYNADALGRGLDLDVAIENFRYCFGVLLDGMKTEGASQTQSIA